MSQAWTARLVAAAIMVRSGRTAVTPITATIIRDRTR
jgi:hypothetical protein